MKRHSLTDCRAVLVCHWIPDLSLLRVKLKAAHRDQHMDLSLVRQRESVLRYTALSSLNNLNNSSHSICVTVPQSAFVFPLQHVEVKG